MFIGFGTTLNILSILVGAAIGVIVGNKFKETT
ncbi:MAG: DUF554 domain-containing protein, partial [Actinobacteria bacterium]|nr:DUF554 domain-containing protein [Actinomycetota bacterium]